MSATEKIFESKNYKSWEMYKEEHPEILDIEKADEIQKYEDAVFALVMRLFR